jgi:hypothetical protein
MNMKHGAKLFAVALFLILGCSWAGSFSAAAQFRDLGKVGSWTTGPVERRHEQSENPHLRVVRAAKQNGFDRVVFEFTGPMPNYSLKYLKGRVFDDEDGPHRIRIAGNAFIHVTFNQLPADEVQAGFSSAKNFSPVGRLKLRALFEVQEKTLFEGFYDFLLGIKSRRAFRVTELQDPARVAIDFKH